MKVNFNKKNSRIAHTLYIASLTMIVATFIVVVVGALLLPAIGTATTKYDVTQLSSDLFKNPVNWGAMVNTDGIIAFPIPTHMGIWNINLDNAKATSDLNDYFSGKMPSALVFAGMMAALDGCFTYSLTTLGLITVILFGITSALSVCSFSMFFILRVKFDRHQMLAIIISFGLMAATVITFLLLKLNASDAVQHPYRYVPLYQGNKPQEWSGRYVDGTMTITSFGKICLVYSALVGAVIAGLIALTNYDFVKMHKLAHTPNHPKYAK